MSQARPPESSDRGASGKQMSARQRSVGQAVGNVIAWVAILALAWALYHHFA